MDQEGIFKTTAFGGFDKKSVLSYIDTLTEKYHDQEEELRNQIAEYSKAQDSQVEYIEKLEAQLAEAEKKLEAVAGQLEQERAMAPQSTGQVDELTQRNRELEQKLEDAEQELKVQLERNRQLQFKVEGASYKSQKYDELSAQVGDAMLIAKTNADKLVSDARQQAETLLRESKAKAEKTVREADIQAQTTTQRAKRDSARQLDQAQAQAAETLNKAKQAAADKIEQAEAKATEILEQAQEQMRHFNLEITSFQGDTSRLRKSVEEILFVLNDRVDVMQEIVRQMDSKAASFEKEKKENASDFAQKPFTKTEDEAGYFGGGA